MKQILLALSIITIVSLSSIAQKENLQQQINEQVWKPFITSFNNGDDEGLKRVHSLDVIRVEQDSKLLMLTSEQNLEGCDATSAK